MTAGPQGAASLRRLKKRSEFLRAARGSRAGRRGFALQVAPVDSPAPGVGFTVSRKVGNAPERNRVKRRLRAAARACAQAFRPQHDYVLIGRREALSVPFSELVAGLEQVLVRLDGQPALRHRADGRRNKGT
jgi:ribonuclease P protein component